MVYDQFTQIRNEMKFKRLFMWRLYQEEIKQNNISQNQVMKYQF